MSNRRGFTLIEMIIAIVILGVGLAGVLMAFKQASRYSADPLVNRQLLALAEGMLEEVLSQSYAPVAGAGGGGCARDGFNDVSDYNGYSQAPCTIDGSAIGSLAAYNIAVSVQVTPLGTVAAAKRIVVTASRGSDSLQLVGWRTGYAP